ncbi:MAG: hypothetical protein GY953_50275 [bacterium]|nr:hypothetical protein [bacterium]
MNRRVLIPCETRDDFWWMGTAPGGPGRVLNNWTPWIDSNWLAANLLLEADGDRRRRTTHKILRSLDRFLEGYHDDGGCDEGPGYWNRAGGSLFDNLELLHSATGGKIDVYDDPLIGEIGRYIVRAHIHGVYFTNFADAAAKVRLDGDLVYRYGHRIGDRDMQALGAWAAADRPVSIGSLGRALPALFHLETLRTAEGHQPLLRDVWMPGIQMMAARRRAGSPEGLYVAAHGGHNAESHNHNDVGDFVIYVNGEPAIIDIGVETYTAKTFSSRRYEIWTMQSAWHNLPTIDGHMQAAGREFQADDVSYHASDDTAEFALDIAPAYPTEAGVESWKRNVTLHRRDDQVTVADSYSLARQPAKITQTLMTPCEAATAPGRLTLSGSGFTLQADFDPNLFTATIEEVEVKDQRLRSSWGARLRRILLTAKNPPAKGTWTLRFHDGVGR